MTLADGKRIEGEFPNRVEERPRLLYHRYFMLTEFLNTLYNPEAPSEVALAYIQGYADHLAHEYGSDDVKVFLRRHYVPEMSAAREGQKLADPAKYVELQVWPRPERGQP